MTGKYLSKLTYNHRFGAHLIIPKYRQLVKNSKLFYKVLTQNTETVRRKKLSGQPLCHYVCSEFDVLIQAVSSADICLPVFLKVLFLHSE